VDVLLLIILIIAASAILGVVIDAVIKYFLDDTPFP